MNVLDLLKELGVHPLKVAASKGGEYHSPCPDASCDGKDRFCVWPEEGSDGRFWCRKCLRSGDAIQFCRDYMGMDFKSACLKVGKQSKNSSRNLLVRPKEKFIAKSLAMPSKEWEQRSADFVQKSHQYLLENPNLLNADKDRGLTIQSIVDFQLGWNSKDVFEPRELWGLPDLSKEGGSRLLCLPQGIVIPSFRDDIPVRVKIRRHNWKEGDEYPKYHITAGGITCPSFYGDIYKPLVIVEAELDAMLLQQLAADCCSCIALGGVTIRPDIITDRIIRQATTVLYALDFDDSGKKAYSFWKSTYHHIKPWPVPKGKSPGDAFKDHGVNLREWILKGIDYYNKGKVFYDFSK